MMRNRFAKNLWCGLLGNAPEKFYRSNDKLILYAEESIQTFNLFLIENKNLIIFCSYF